jgi:hypothetical protein
LKQAAPYLLLSSITSYTYLKNVFVFCGAKYEKCRVPHSELLRIWNSDSRALNQMQDFVTTGLYARFMKEAC